jgi:hypothetical protein
LRQPLFGPLQHLSVMQTRFVLVGCDATAKKIFAAAAVLLMFMGNFGNSLACAAPSVYLPGVLIDANRWTAARIRQWRECY